MRVLLIALLLVVSACDTSNKKCNAYLTWEPPAFRADGSNFNIEDIEKYTIYMTDSDPSRTPLVVIEVTEPIARNWTIENIGGKTRYFYITVTGKNGLTSANSNILSKKCS